MEAIELGRKNAPLTSLRYSSNFIFKFSQRARGPKAFPLNNSDLIAIILDNNSSEKNKEDAFAKLIGKNKVEIMRQIRKRGNLGLDDIDDVFQNSCIRIWECLSKGKYQEQGKPLAWIYTIVHRSTMDFFRKKIIIPLSLDADGVFELEETSLPLHSLFFEDKINTLLKVLSPNEKCVFKLKFEGYNHSEIANQLSLSSTQRSKNLYYSAKKKLRKSLLTNLANFQP